MFGCEGNIQVIFYNKDEMKCFGGYINGFEIENQEPVFSPIENSFNRMIIKPIGPTYAHTTIKLEHEVIQLDPTTMKRIARFNLEKENEELANEIEEHKKNIESLKAEYRELNNRLQTIRDIGADIWENGTKYKKDDDWEF